MLFSPSCREFNSIENSTKKDIQHFCIGPILLQKIKSNGRWSAEKLTVKLYLVPGVRNGQIYLMPNDSYEQFYLAVKGLN